MTHPVLINYLYHFHSIGWLAGSLKAVLLAKYISVGLLALVDSQFFSFSLLKKDAFSKFIGPGCTDLAVKC